MVFKYMHNLDPFLWEEITRKLISNIFVDFVPIIFIRHKQHVSYVVSQTQEREASKGNQAYKIKLAVLALRAFCGA